MKGIAHLSRQDMPATSAHAPPPAIGLVHLREK